MTAAIAVALLINGVQIWLPRPAVMLDGAVWVPARAVCAQRGVAVSMTGAAPNRRLVLQVGGKLTGYPISPTPTPASATLISGTAYLPARSLATALHGVARWNAGSRSLELWLPWGGDGPELAEIGDLVSSGLDWRDRQVELTGRVAGRWGAGGALPDDAFALRGGRLDISCSTQELTGIVSVPPALSAIGDSARVVGTATLDAAGLPVVKVLSATVPDARTPLRMWVAAERAVAEAGSQLWIEWRLENPTERPVLLPPEGGRVTLEVSSPAVSSLRQALDLGPQSLLRGPSIPPGFRAGGAVTWRAPAGAAGEYRARLRLGAWPPADCSFRVAPPPPRPAAAPALSVP